METGRQAAFAAAAFASYAAGHGAQPAVVSADRQLTYAELDGRARRLAGRLLEHNRDMGTPVFVLLDDEIDRCTALLAAQMAGQAYVPLDPRNPQARLDLMLQTAPGSTLVVERHAAPLAAPGQPLILMEEIGEGDGIPAALQPVDPQALAWIIFTSGSTGRPKGVMQTFDNSAFYTRQAVESLYLQPGDRFAIASSLTTHAGVVTSLAIIAGGGTLVFLEPGKRAAAELRQWIAGQRLGGLLIAPALFRHLVNGAADTGALRTLRYLRLTGEPVTSGDVALFNRVCPAACILVVGYGATETGGISQAYFHHPAPNDGRVAVGKAQPEVTILLLDEDGRAAAANEPGEIVVKSRHLSPGYWQMPEQTAAAFSETADGQRLYRTGDLGILGEDGMLAHIGRKDAQVQILGQRVELAEIEAALRALPFVDEAAVIDEQAPTGETRLAAFVAMKQDSGAGGKEIREGLAGVLPAFMLPQRMMMVDRMPLTHSGKIDRQALAGAARPAPDQQRPPATPPADDTERMLAAIWRELLGVEISDRNSDFLALGGDSLLSMQLLARIEEVTGQRLPMRLLFASPTIAELALALRTEAAPAADQILVPLRPGGERRPLFAPHGVWGDTLTFKHVVPRLAAEQPFYAFEALGLQPGQAADERMEDMARHYIAALRTAQPAGPYQLVGFCFGGVIAYEMACQLEAAGEAVALLALIEASTPRDLHNAAPLYDRRRLATIGAALPGWAEQSGARLKKLVMGGRQGHNGRQVNEPGKTWGGKLPEDGDDIVACRPEAQRRLREHHRDVQRRYKPRPYGGRLTLIQARQAHAGPVLRGPFDPLQGWGTLARGGVDLRFVDGAHHTVLLDPYAAGLAQALAVLLQEAAGAG